MAVDQPVILPFYFSKESGESFAPYAVFSAKGASFAIYYVIILDKGQFIITRVGKAGD
ncbi:MAG: hypothetical protein HY811_06860 [Planctomycetes bacterium]|nr:hypothetical protein [Planctomycetota bacterium]